LFCFFRPFCFCIPQFSVQLCFRRFFPVLNTFGFLSSLSLFLLFRSCCLGSCCLGFGRLLLLPELVGEEGTTDQQGAWANNQMMRMCD